MMSRSGKGISGLQAAFAVVLGLVVMVLVLSPLWDIVSGDALSGPEDNLSGTVDNGGGGGSGSGTGGGSGSVSANSIQWESLKIDVVSTEFGSTATISLVFDEDIDPESVETGDFALLAADEEAEPSRVQEVDGNEVVLGHSNFPYQFFFGGSGVRITGEIQEDGGDGSASSGECWTYVDTDSEDRAPTSCSSGEDSFDLQEMTATNNGGGPSGESGTVTASLRFTGEPLGPLYHQFRPQDGGVFLPVELSINGRDVTGDEYDAEISKVTTFPDSKIIVEVDKTAAELGLSQGDVFEVRLTDDIVSSSGNVVSEAQGDTVVCRDNYYEDGASQCGDIGPTPAIDVEQGGETSEKYAPGEPVTFSYVEGSVSETISSYEWTGDDELSESGEDASEIQHTYEDVGEYEVTLTVTYGEDDSTASATESIVVSNWGNEVRLENTGEDVLFRDLFSEDCGEHLIRYEDAATGEFYLRWTASDGASSGSGTFDGPDAGDSVLLGDVAPGDSQARMTVPEGGYEGAGATIIVECDPS